MKCLAEFVGLSFDGNKSGAVVQKELMIEIINGYIGAYNAMDVPCMLSYLHSDIVFHNVTDGRYNLSVNGKPEFETLALRALNLFKSRKQTVRQIVYEGETARAKINYEGVLAVDMAGFGVAGERIEFIGRSEFVFKDDLIHMLVDIS